MRHVQCEREFAIKVGIPAKSGVSGGIMGISPYNFGIGIFGPALDEKATASRV